MGSGTNKATKKDVSKFQDVLAPIVFFVVWRKCKALGEKGRYTGFTMYIYIYIHKPILS